MIKDVHMLVTTVHTLLPRGPGEPGLPLRLFAPCKKAVVMLTLRKKLKEIEKTFLTGGPLPPSWPNRPGAPLNPCQYEHHLCKMYVLHLLLYIMLTFGPRIPGEPDSPGTPFGPISPFFPSLPTEPLGPCVKETVLKHLHLLHQMCVHVCVCAM